MATLSEQLAQAAGALSIAGVPATAQPGQPVTASLAPPLTVNNPPPGGSYYGGVFSFGDELSSIRFL